MKKNIHPFVRLLLLFVLLLAAEVLVAVVFGVVQFIGGGDLGGVGFTMWTQALSQIVGMALPVFLVAHWFYGDEKGAFLQFDFGRGKWLLGLVGIVVMLLLLPAIDWLTVWNDGWHWSGAWQQLEQTLRSLSEMSEKVVDDICMRPGVGPLIANLIVIALIPAVCEELFFRVGIQGILQRWTGNVHVAVWVTAAVFSLAHFELFAFLPRFVMGAVLGYLFVGSSSVVPNMLAHFINNATIVLLYNLSAGGVIDFDPEASWQLALLPTLCCLLAAGALMWIYFLKNVDNETKRPHVALDK
ncbi:MAG: CPBP family intramembrane metalloprotease [Bacteroidales bacterium]|nr:CPBP family intramembrane metalloprotease [Bacteroidales bacterium]